MAMKSKARGGGAIGFNMTPMIDIVFQLIIFFMLVSQFYQLKVEEVKLPVALKADPKREIIQDFEQVVVNVVAPTQPGDRTTRIIVEGKTLVTSDDGGKVPVWEPLISLLKARKAKQEATVPKGKPINVILRSDASVPYETIGSIMLSASSAGIEYWWVQASLPGKDPESLQFLGAPPAGGS